MNQVVEIDYDQYDSDNEADETHQQEKIMSGNRLYESGRCLIFSNKNARAKAAEYALAHDL